MAVPLLQTTGTTVQLVYTEDPDVDPKVEGPPRWIPSSDAVCKKGADLVDMRALNGEERWLADMRDDTPGRFYFWCDMAVQRINGDSEAVHDWLRALDQVPLILLATAGFKVTAGMPLDYQEDPEGEPFPEDG